MVRLNRIYTRTGDKGDTGLGDGERRPKYDPRVDAYGEVDELNCVIGLARLHTGKGEGDLARIEATLARVQNDLFDIGGDLCFPPKEGEDQALRVTEAQVTAIERAIDDLNAELQPLTSFVLPGGTPAAAELHHARTVCRRAERAVVYLSSREQVGAPVIAYLNRLSDYLFVAARFANARGKSDVLWIPGANRGG